MSNFNRIEHAILERQLLALGCHGVRLERNTVELGEPAQIRVIAENEGQLHRKLPGALAEQQVIEAVSGLGDQDERAKWAADHIQCPGRVVVSGYRHDRRLESLAGHCGFHLEPHEEGARVGARELLGLRDVAAGGHDRPADRVHDARPVGADQGQHPVVR